MPSDDAGGLTLRRVEPGERDLDVHVDAPTLTPQEAHGTSRDRVIRNNQCRPHRESHDRVMFPASRWDDLGPCRRTRCAARFVCSTLRAAFSRSPAKRLATKPNQTTTMEEDPHERAEQMAVGGGRRRSCHHRHGARTGRITDDGACGQRHHGDDDAAEDRWARGVLAAGGDPVGQPRLEHLHCAGERRRRDQQRVFVRERCRHHRADAGHVHDRPGHRRRRGTTWVGRRRR